ncbi:hypothetical protein MRBLMN1_005669 [Chitinophaga ginsengisegetis]|uniref:HYR-like domain-containing protein n=1 Tax=Chitinophaga ginsengisegetis TaxID=393003 RepID=UPI00342F21BF
MKVVDLPSNFQRTRSFYFKLPTLLLTLILLIMAGFRGMAQSANLDQGANGKSTAPTSPVDWINGNLNSNQAHFLEGYSVPYRAILTNLVVNKTYTLVVGLDIMNGGKHALDYITQFQRLEPHGVFLHTTETVNPILNITGFPVSYFTSTDVEPIPAPSSAGSPVSGQPAASFNALPAAERVMTGYNADLTSVVYASEGSLTASQSETVINITFKALKETVVLAWGGHIASIIDWGKDPVTGETNSASSINGSPYHMRLKNWIIDGNVVSIGNQDRSLKTDAVFIPPKCTVSGPATGCMETSSLSYTSTVDDATGLTYLWSIIGSNTANAKIVNNTLANIQVVPVGAAFTAGTFNLQLIVTRDGLSDTCYLGSHINPGQTITITKVMANAGADQSITHLDTAYLSASASGGTAPYTFSWSPVTGLSDPNIYNPEFIPTGTGTFQFVVTATDNNGCSGKDTVVITVIQHPVSPCVIDGPDPVCPGSINVYKGPLPSEVGSYSWSITGDGSITGAINKDTVTVLAGSTCGSYKLQLITTTPDGKVTNTCERILYIKDTIAPVLSGTAPDASITCSKDLPAAPAITASDNCLADVKVQMSQETTDSTCVNKFTIVRKWWAADACGNTSDTIKQTITVNDNVKPVISADFDKEVNLECLKDIPALPSPTATDNCDVALTPVYSETGSGTACDSTIIRTWIFADVCGNSDSVKQTIHIKDNTAPVLSGTVTDLQLSCAKDIPGPQSITASDNCSHATVYSSAVITDSTCVNKFTLVRKWWAADACGNTSDTLKQTIVVNDNIAPVVISKGNDKLVNCGAAITFDTPTFTDNCGNTFSVTTSDRREGTSCPFKYIRRWTATDTCGNSTYVEQGITVSCCVSYCTYTQGFYGNRGGVGCTPGGRSFTAQQMMANVTDAQPGDSAIFGLKSTGKFFTLFLSDVTNNSIFNMLPGGGTPVALKGYATYSKTATWPNVPISTAKTTLGKINNVLLAQTMALFFNMGVTPTLPGLTIDGDTLFTAQLTTCGSSTPVSKIDTFRLPSSVVNYLSSTGQSTVQGLFTLANKYLGGQTVSGVSISDVNAAINAINNGFDKCAVLIGWGTSVAPVNNVTNISYSNADQAILSKEPAPQKLTVTVFPNPYSEVITFRYVAPETGKAQLILYDIQGHQVDVIYKGVVSKGSTQQIEYHVADNSRILLIYKLIVGQSSASGKIVPVK